MKKFAIPEDAIGNLFIFLERTNLTGNEVPAFNQIISILNNPLPPEKSINEQLQTVSLTELMKEVERRQYKAEEKKTKVLTKNDEPAKELVDKKEQEQLVIDKNVNVVDKKEEIDKKLESKKK